MPFNRVKLIQCDTALTPDQGTTSGAQSHPTNFNQAQSRARRRDRARSAHAAAPPRDSAFRPINSRSRTASSASKRTRRRRVSYGELVGGRKFAMPLNPAPNENIRASGPCWATPVPRVEIPGDGHRPVRVRPQRARARHVAWARRPAAGRRRDT